MVRLISAVIALLLMTASAWGAELFWCDRGDRAAKKGQLAQAINNYTRCIESDGVERERVAAAFFGRAKAYANSRQYDHALMDYNKALELRPDDPEIITMRSSLRADRGEDDLALADANHALELDPNTGPAFYLRALIHVRMGQLEQTLADFGKAIDLVPAWSDPYRRRGLIHTRMENYDAAIEDYRRALRLNRNDVIARSELGIAYAMTGQFGRAIENLGRAKRLNPNYVMTYHYLGLVYFIQGRFYDRAIARLNKASQLAPDFAWPIFLRGMVKVAQGRPADAVPDFAFSAKHDLEDAGYLIWLYIAQARSGDDGLSTLAENAARLDFEEWIEQVISMYLGKIDPETVANAARKITKREELMEKCRMLFYVGQYYLIHGDVDKAVPYFNSTVDVGILDCPELTIAKTELARLE